MGWASYQEDNLDARGESKSYKSRKPKVSHRREPRNVPVAKTQHVPEEDICFESLLNNLPVPKPKPSRPIPKDDINARGESKRPKPSRPKPSLKARQHIHRREPRKRRYAPVAKTRYVAPDEIQRRIQLEIIRQDKESKAIYPN